MTPRMLEDLKSLITQLRSRIPTEKKFEADAAKDGLYFSQGEASGRATAYSEIAEKLEQILESPK